MFYVDDSVNHLKYELILNDPPLKLGFKNLPLHLGPTEMSETSPRCRTKHG